MASDENDNPPKAACGIPLLITRRQRAELRDLGFSEDEIGVMTPGEAHRYLAERPTYSTPAEPD